MTDFPDNRTKAATSGILRIEYDPIRLMTRITLHGEGRRSGDGTVG